MKTLNWRNVPQPAFHLYARSFYTAAKTLAGPSISIPLPSRPSTFAKCFPPGEGWGAMIIP
jgi:hypothetical protein